MTLRRTTSTNPARHSKPSVPLGNQKVVQDSHSLNQRPALVAIQQNIRRTKSRLGLSLAADEDEETPTGSKRKRPQVGNENVVAGPSQARSLKRFKPSASPTQSDSDEEAMETEHDENNDEEQSSEFYLSQAPRSQLLRLRKDHLIKLYAEANITRPVADAAQLTRSELTDALLVARSRAKRGVSKRAPTQRPRHGRPGQAPYTPDSDDNQLARGLAVARVNLRRNATGLEVNAPKLPVPLGRSFSLNTLVKNMPRREKRVRVDSNASTLSDEPPPITPISPPVTRKRSNVEPKHGMFSSDDLTEVSEADELPATYEPSPRRLRSRGERKENSLPTGRHLPPRVAKPEKGALQEEDDDDDEEEEEEEEEEENYESGSDEDGVPASSAVDTDRDDDDDSSASSSPDPSRRGRQSQTKTGSKGSNKKRKARLTTPPSEDDEDMNETPTGHGTQEYGLIQESPRRLRNGKVRQADEAGEEIDTSEEEEESNSGDTEYMEEDEEEDTEQEAAVEAPASTSDNDVDDEVDLSEETAKSLGRYRRYELVRLCESRNLDVEGTKPQLVKALLEWRDSRQPSSSGASTVRAPSTEHPTKRKPRPPVLERANRVHVTQPRTPPLSNEPGIENVSGVTVHGTAEEPELEFDLGTLGLEDREIPYEKLAKKEKIGSGGFKDVYSGTLGSRKVAIAEFRGQLTPMDIKELQLLRDLQHDNIVRFLGVSVPENTKETPVLMVSELCSNGDLFDYIRNEKAASLTRVLRLMYDIACGLEYLHTHKPSIIHRDCKSSNILITRNGRAKIADFGLAKVKQSTRSMVRSLVGTVNWQAPELWHAHPKYDHKVDVFSCAMVFWEILQWHLPNKKYPWEGMNEHAIYETVGTKRQRPSISGLRKQWCPEVVDLIERMWAQEPRERPTMSEVVTELDNIRA